MVSREVRTSPRPEGTRVLGVDPGTRCVGWAIVEAQGAKLRAIRYDTLRARANLPIAERLLHLARGLREVVADHRPDEAAIEEAFHGRDPRAALRIGEARGALHLILAEAGLSVTGYTNNVVKKSVTGVGRASKEQVQSMVQSILSLDEAVRSPDAADALAVACCHHQRRNLAGGARGPAAGLPQRIEEAIARQESGRQKSGRQKAGRPKAAAQRKRRG